MKSFIALVVSIGLVLSNDHGRDNDRDYTTFDDRDAIITRHIQNKFRNMETLENVRQLKKPTPQIKCENSTCKVCTSGFCLTVSYKPETDSFDIIGRFLGVYTFSSHIVVKPWSDCEILDTYFTSITSCVKIQNVKIMDGKVCADVMVYAGYLIDKAYTNKCFQI